MLNVTADFLVQQSWQLVFVFGMVLIITWVLRKASSHWSYLLWLVVIAKCLTPPMFSVPLAILPTNSAIGPATRNAVYASATAADTETQPSIADVQSNASSLLPRDQSVAVAPSVRRPNSVNSLQFSLRQWLTIAWMIVAVMMFAYVLWKVWSTDRRLRRTRLPVDAETNSTVAELANALGMSNVPTVYAASPAAQPFVWGWLRGDVYLPHEFSTIGSVEQRRAILAHELAHVARWDAAANLIQIIVQAIFFFHPLIWWANAKIRQEREKCCDEIVLSGLGIRPRAYCEAIVNMLTLEYQARHSTPTLAVTGSMKNTTERMSSILTPDRQFRRGPSRVGVFTLFLVAVSVLPTAFVVTTRAENPAPSAKVNKPDAKATETATENKDLNTGTWQTGQLMDFRLINAQTKEPIPEATLELQYTGKGIDFQDVKTQTTDADGWSRIKLPDLPLTEARVYPSKAGFVPLRVYWGGEPHVALPKSITIPLEPENLFGGTIRDELGKPIPDVTVTVHYWGAKAIENPHLRPHIDATATSDQNGRWRMNIMPAEIDEQNLGIFVTHPDYISDHLLRGMIPLPVTPQPPIDKLFDQTAVMIMRKGESIKGQVVDVDGRPIPNARIFDSEHYWYSPDKTRAKTNQEGNFRIAGVELKELARPDRTRMSLTVEAAGYAPELIDAQRSSPLKIELKAGQSVRGRVVDENGKAVEGVAVRAWLWRQQRNRLHLEAKTDSDGKFQLMNVPTDEVEYTISKAGYMAVEHFLMSPTSDEYSATLKAPLRIVGTVVDAETGQPLKKFTLIRGTDSEDGRAPWWTRHDIKTITTGRYETAIEQQGFSWLVRVEAEGYLPAISRIFRPYNPDRGEVTFDFKLSKANPLTGIVLGPDGKALAGATVYLATQQMYITNRKVDFPEKLPIKTDAAGVFEFPPEVQPFCVVVLHKQGVAMATEKDFKSPPRLSIKPWTTKNETLQIIRKPAPGQSVDFPVKYP